MTTTTPARRVDPETVTGAEVREIREQYKLSRRDLAELCARMWDEIHGPNHPKAAKHGGWHTESRVATIETKDGWHQDDRLVVARVFNEKILINAPVGRRRHETGEQRAARLMQQLDQNGHTLQADGGEVVSPFDSTSSEPTDIVITDEDDDGGLIVEYVAVAPPAPPLPEASAPPAYALTDTARRVLGLERETCGEPTVYPGFPCDMAPGHQGGHTPDFAALANSRAPQQEAPREVTSVTGLPDAEQRPSVAGVPEAHIVEQRADEPIPEPARPDGPLITAVKMLSNSEVQTWLRCRRKWWLAYYRRLGVVPTAQSYTNVRHLGTRVHRALAAWYVPDGQQRTDPRDAWQRAVTEDWTEMAKLVPEEELSAAWEQFSKDTEIERIMVEGYVEWIEETGQDSDLVITMSEEMVSADVTVDVDGIVETVRLVALMDVRGALKQNNAPVFVDHKTVGDLTKPVRTLHMNPQMLHYMLLEFLTQPEGTRHATAIYNMLRKVKRTERAKPPFYARETITHNPAEIESYRIRTLGAARDIIRAERALAVTTDHRSIAYPTPSEACSYDCDFFAVCTMFDDGSRVEDVLLGNYIEINPLDRYEGKGVLA